MTRDARDTALEWFVRLRGPAVSARDREAHAAWLAEDAVHQAAWAAIEVQWRNLDGLDRWAAAELQQLAQSQAPRAPVRLSHWAAAAASVAALAGVLAVTPVFMGTQNTEHLETARGEQRRVMLEDGSRLHLNSSSSVDIRFNPRERKVRLLEGEGLFDVAHDPNRPFVVQVPGSRVVAVGTRFNVHLAGDDLTVTVLEGKVMVVPDRPAPVGGVLQEVLLEPSQLARIDVSGVVEVVTTVDPLRLVSWDKGLLIFDNTPLSQVVAELSRYVDGEVRIAPGVPHVAVTGTIKIRDKRTMLRVLSEVAPVTAVSTNSQVTTLVYTPEPVVRNGP